VGKLDSERDDGKRQLAANLLVRRNKPSWLQPVASGFSRGRTISGMSGAFDHAHATSIMFATATVLDGKRPDPVYLASLAIRRRDRSRWFFRIDCPNR